MARHERKNAAACGDSDTISGTSEAAPTATNISERPLTHLSDETRKGVGIMLTDSLPEIDLASLQNQCVEYLRLCREDSTTLSHTRLYFIQKSREYGLTNQAIGEALGITEGAVRGLLNRAGK